QTDDQVQRRGVLSPGRLRLIDRRHERDGAGHWRGGVPFRPLHRSTVLQRLPGGGHAPVPAARGGRPGGGPEPRGAPPGGGLPAVAADLLSDAGWPEAVAGCDFVLHVASPFPANAPKDENELIVPAREGALRVLRAARDAGVKRVVLTSSFAAIGYGQKPTDRPFTEQNWTDPGAEGVTPYVKSKTLAERAAWDFVARDGGPLEL